MQPGQRRAAPGPRRPRQARRVRADVHARRGGGRASHGGMLQNEIRVEKARERDASACMRRHRAFTKP